MLKKGLFVCLFLFLTGQAQANEVDIVKGGALHEAFITQEYGDLLLEAVATPPPAALREQIPMQTDRSTEWIPGYWTWSKERKDYLWVCGVWRRPPADHQWISGQWKQLPEGWVWLPGFWSKTGLKNISFIDLSPPDEIDEMVMSAPGDDYFWIPGYWEYDESSQSYVWFSGKWERFDPQWVFVPGRYLWREKGFFFIPAYWDWPLETRGAAYSCVAVQNDSRVVIVYEPSVMLKVPDIIELYYPNYPSYLCCFQHHFHFHQEMWDNLGVPPWWGWQQWWCLTWIDQWALWWWWCHAGYPQPFWMTAQLAQMMPPAPGSILNLMQRVLPPPFVTPNGVIGPGKLIRGIDKVTDSGRPIIPTTPGLRMEIEDAVIPRRPKPLIRPAGILPETAPPKPNFGPGKGELKRPPQRTKIPDKPVISPPQPPIRNVPPTFEPTPPPVKKPPVPPPQRPPSRPPMPPPPRRPPQAMTPRPTPPPTRPRPPTQITPPPSRPPSIRPPTQPRTPPPSNRVAPPTQPMAIPTSEPSGETLVAPSNPTPLKRPQEPHPTTSLEKKNQTAKPLPQIPIPPDPNFRRPLLLPGRSQTVAPVNGVLYSDSPHHRRNFERYNPYEVSTRDRYRVRPIPEPQIDGPVRIPTNIPPDHILEKDYRKTPVTANPYYDRQLPLQESNLHYYPFHSNPNYVKPVPDERYFNHHYHNGDLRYVTGKYLTPYYPQYESPVQGIRPELHWPQKPFAQQNRGNFMQRPMPKVNPDGPSPMHPDSFWHWRY